MATASEARQSFRHWRRRRPFWGGLLLLLAGVELFISANLTLGEMEVHVGPQGFLSYLLPLILLLCGLLVWYTPAQRLFYGILGLLTALYSLIGLNLGGFFAGMVVGIVGGALTIAWAPARLRPSETLIVGPDQPTAESSADREQSVGDAPTEFLPGFSEPSDAQLSGAQPSDAEPSAAQPGDAEPAHAQPVDPRPAAAPSEHEAPRPGSGVHRKAFVIAIVPLAVTAAVLVGGSHTPARADACPEGVPSRSIAATPSKSVTKSPEGLAKKASTPKKTATSSTGKKNTTPSPSASAGAGDDDEESDHPILDGIKDGVGDIVDGIGELLGIGDDPSASPSPSATPASSAPVPSAPAPSGSQPAPSASVPVPPVPGGSGTPSGSASPSPTPTSTDVPCLGPRVMGKVAGADDVPTVSVEGGLLEGDLLTMYNSTYDGVSTLNTSKGTVKALKFSMTKSVTEPFSLTIPERNGAHTVIKSNQLTTEGNVRFYTPKFQGKLFGLIPVTFTPEQPPPLTLPKLWFTDVKIQLTFIRCDTLTGHPLKITEPA